MLVVDANVLIYAVNESSDAHGVAREWLKSALGGTEAVALPWVVCLAFLRLSTHPAVFPHPLGADEALDVLENWLGAPPVVTPEPTRRHFPLLSGLLQGVPAPSNVVNDAHLAALAFEHGATLVTFDRDFARFDGLRLLRPT